MNILYLGNYRRRFDPVISHLKKVSPGGRIMELCFGDIYIAQFCKRHGYHWTGLDINGKFVETAKRMGYNAHQCDLTRLEEFPRADVCVMIGSFYHFAPQAKKILSMMLDAADNVILSEPVVNLSSKRGLIGWLARNGTNAGKGAEAFRFCRTSFITMLKENVSMIGYTIEDIEHLKREVVVKLKKNGKHGH